MEALSRKKIVIAIAVVLVAFLVYRSSGMLHLGGFSGDKLLGAIRQANPYYLGTALLLIYVCYAIRALRWRVLQLNLGPSDFGTIYRMTLAGFAAVFLLGRAGEPVRPLLLARKENLPVSDVFGIYVLERVLDTASTAVIAAVGLLLFETHAHSAETAPSLGSAARTAGAFLFVGVLVAIAFLIYLRLHGTALLERRSQGWLATTGWRSSLARVALGFARGVQTIRTWGDLVLAVLYSAAHWSLVIVVYYAVSRSFGGTLGTLTMSDAMLVLAFTLVGSTVQLPGVGGGSQAGSIIAYTAIFGVDKESAVAAAVVLWLITFAACSLAGVPLLLREGWSLGALKNLAEQEKPMEVQAAKPAGSENPMRP